MRKAIILTMFFLVFFSPVLALATDVGGNITENTTWTKANSPCTVTSTVQVFDGVTLTIEPGTKIMVAPDQKIRVAGSLLSNGENTNPIKFTSGQEGDMWGGIELLNSSGSQFTNTIFENAYNAIDLQGSSSPVFENNIFRNNSVAITDSYGYASMSFFYNDFINNFSCFSGIRTTNKSEFYYNNFYANQNVFEYGYYFGTTEISQNNFVNNEFVLKAPEEGYGYGIVDASNNWWGTTDTSIIDEIIEDKYDDVALQIMNYNPIQLGEIEGIGSSIDITPVSKFIAVSTMGAPPLKVKFADKSLGDITAWLWDFGDGSTSTEQNPTHTYTTLGNYTVGLTVTGPGGSDTETKTDYIKVGHFTKAMPWLPLLLDD